MFTANMKKLVLGFALISVLCLWIGCGPKPLNPAEAKLCSKWVAPNSRQVAGYIFYNNRTFTDLALQHAKSFNKHSPRGISWAFSNHKLVLLYQYPVKVLGFISFPVKINLTYTIRQITDSTLVLVSPANKHYPERVVSLVKAPGGN